MKRKNGEGTWGKKTIRGIEFVYFRDSERNYTYGKTTKEVKENPICLYRLFRTALQHFLPKMSKNFQSCTYVPLSFCHNQSLPIKYLLHTLGVTPDTAFV